ncbi:MAG: membrane protein insertase YidC, partial [Rhodobacterales bacterium]|nr:membrane protein insertase YidC [Rhodobacterales bacterium]
MDDQNKNLLLATALSFAVILIWFVLFPPPEPTEVDPSDPAVTSAPVASTPTDAASGTTETAQVAEAAADTPRVAIETARVTGSISLLGGRIDQLSLKNYRESLEPDADIVTVLSPIGQPHAYYALYGWAPGMGVTLDDVPGANTMWQLESGETLSPDAPVTLVWDNGRGLTFRRQIAIDENFMFTVTQSVQNTGTETASMAPYGIIARHGEPEGLKNFFILHEGLVAMADGTLTETDYGDMPEFEFNEREGARAEVTQVTENGWIGFTDHYWMTTLVPEQGKPYKQVLKYVPTSGIYQAEVRPPAIALAAGAEASSTIQLFAGAKEWATIRAYEIEGGIPGFLDSIDWGWFYFLTKPIFAVLHWLNAMIGNMGLAIIALTFFLKFLVLPLAYKSYVSMARMKELQPEMEAIK